MTVTRASTKPPATLTDDPSAHRRIVDPPPNLDFLLRRRTQFLRDHLAAGERVLEVGAGLGITARYVPDLDLLTTDARPKPWIDQVADIQALPFDDESFDAAVALNVLHHLNSPRRALAELIRVIRPGGLLLIAEPHAGLVVRAVLLVGRHEYIDRSVDPFTSDACQTRPEFPGGGNNVLGDRLFGDLDRFRQAFPGLAVVHHRFVECLTFINSGGVGARGPSVPLPRWGLRALGWIDDALVRLSPTFAMAREIVFRKGEPIRGLTPTDEAGSPPPGARA